MIELTRLRDMPNIGAALEQKLIEAGVHTPENLRVLGSREAFMRLKIIDPDCCLSCLFALEGAVRGIRWHDLDHETKADLKAFHLASHCD